MVFLKLIGAIFHTQVAVQKLVHMRKQPYLPAIDDEVDQALEKMDKYLNEAIAEFDKIS